jgi:hypothetical protein
MKKKGWVNIAKSFSAAEKFDVEYYKRLTPAQRLDKIQFLREQCFRINKERRCASRRITKSGRFLIIVIQLPGIKSRIPFSSAFGKIFGGLRMRFNRYLESV